MFHLLVADDDKNTRRLFKAVLEQENYTVLPEDGKAAMNILDREHIDLIVLDIMMPGIDGYTFTEMLKERATICRS